MNSSSEALLSVSFQLNLGYRPQMMIYANSDIQGLISEFVNTHNLKPTAIQIIRDVIYSNIREVLAEAKASNSPCTASLQRQLFANSVSNTQQNLKQTNPSKKTGVKQNGGANKQNRPSLGSKTYARKRSTENNQQKIPTKPVANSFKLQDLQNQYEKQFKQIRTDRLIRNNQQSLRHLYAALTKMNPPGLMTVHPDFIDFSEFSEAMLNALQQFFQKLEEPDFVGLDFNRLVELLHKYQSYDIVYKLSKAL